MTVVLATLFLSGTATAAPPDAPTPTPDAPAPAAEAPAPPTEEERAKEMFKEGNAHYAAGRYEEAAVLFQQAYDLSQRPLLLFNLANVYERMANYDAAAAALRRYLETPDVHDVVSVRERLRRLELTAATTRPAPEPLAPTPEPNPSEAEPERRGSPWTPWVLGTVSVGATASAVTFGYLAQQDRQEAAEFCADGPDGRLFCRTEGSTLLEREADRALIADISTGVAVVGGTAALLTAALRNARNRPEPAVTVVPKTDRAPGVGLVVRTDARRKR